MRSLLTKNEGHLGASCREAVEENLSNVLVTAAKTLIRTATSVKRPFDLHRVAVIGYLFMLREVELSTTLYDRVELNTDTTCISILLTASGTDPCTGGACATKASTVPKRDRITRAWSNSRNSSKLLEVKLYRLAVSPSPRDKAETKEAMVQGTQVWQRRPSSLR